MIKMSSKRKNIIHETSKVYNNKITVPKKVRDYLDLGEGDHILWNQFDKDIIVSKVEKIKKRRFLNE